MKNTDVCEGKNFSRPKRKILPPSRALLIELGPRKFTVTYCLERGWRCWFASKLKWLKSLSPSEAQSELKRQGFTFHWIQPEFGRAIPPPF